MNLYKKILAHNYFAILYFNFKMLPFKQAIKLPFDFYYRVRFENLSGKIFLSTEKVFRGMIKVGGRGSEMFERCDTILDIQGIIFFKGVSELGHGSLLRVEKSGTVEFGNEVRIGAKTKIFCENEIVFRNEIDFSWECQIFDTNFHYLRDARTKSVFPKNGKVIIGSYNWFGNRVTVMKGTTTPDYFTVAANSLCNKDYTSLPNFSVFGGIPAKQIGANTERIFENLEDVTKLDI